MSDTFNDVVQGIYSAVIDSQTKAEDHIAENISRFFDENGSPKCVSIKIPDPNVKGKIQEVFVPHICLSPHGSIKIKELTIRFKIKLDKLLHSQLSADLTGFLHKKKDPAEVEIKFEGGEAPEGLMRINENFIKFLP